MSPSSAPSLCYIGSLLHIYISLSIYLYLSLYIYVCIYLYVDVPVLEVVGWDGAADAGQHEIGVIGRTVLHTEPQTRRREVAHDLLLVGNREGVEVVCPWQRWEGGVRRRVEGGLTEEG